MAHRVGAHQRHITRQLRVERTNHAARPQPLRGRSPAASALDPLKHRVEKFDPLLLQVPHHVFDNRWKGLPDQDVKPERGQ